MKLIQLSNSSLKFVIDDEDFDRVSSHYWYFSIGKSTTIMTSIDANSIYLARFILNYSGELEVDHKNRNPLDNRKENLRLATHQQNAANKSVQSNSTSGYKGVYWEKDSKKWCAKINVNGHQKKLGLYVGKEGAARAYNEAAKKYFGEFAYQNII